MLKIQRSANGRVVFTLSGRIAVKDVKELQELLASEKGAALSAGFEGRDNRQSGCDKISLRLRGG